MDSTSVSKCVEETETSVEALRKKLLQTNASRRKIVVDANGRKVNLYKANQQQLQFACRRDEILSARSASSTDPTCDTMDNFKRVFKLFRSADTAKISLPKSDGGLGAFDYLRGLDDQGTFCVDKVSSAYTGLQYCSMTIDVDGASRKADVFTFSRFPGFVLVRNPFTAQERQSWTRTLALEYPQLAESRSNISHSYSNVSSQPTPPTADSVPSGRKDTTSAETVTAKRSRIEKGAPDQPQDAVHPRQGGVDVIEASVDPRLAWVTLGYHFNWTKRTYSRKERGPFPPRLCRLCRGIVSSVVGAKDYNPSAAIVNYYNLHRSSSMGGHQDDCEEDLTKPVVSLSFGISAVFLMGHRTRAVCPVPVVVHDGDIVLMTGQSRLGFHGVPRIFPDMQQQQTPSGTRAAAALLRFNVNVRQVYREDSLDAELECSRTGSTQ